MNPIHLHWIRSYVPKKQMGFTKYVIIFKMLYCSDFETPDFLRVLLFILFSETSQGHHICNA